MAFQLSRNQRKEFLLIASDEVFLNFIEDTHPVDLLDILHDDEDAAYQIFDRLPESVLAAVIDEADLAKKYVLLSRYSEMKQKEIVQEMSSDELADLIGTLNQDDASKLLNTMSEEDEQEVRHLLSYDPKTAGGIMATEFITLQENMTVEQTLHFLQDVAPDAETAYYLYVVDELNELKGVVSLRDFISSPFHTQIGDIMNPHVFFVTYDLDQEIVAQKFQKYGYLTIPVVTHDHRLLGIVTVDDIMDIMREETTEDIHRLAGIDAREKIDSSIGAVLKSRLPWLVIHLVPAILAAFLVAFFHETIEDIVMLAMFIPVLSILGRNAAIQSLTITVRAMVLDELTFEKGKQAFLKEVTVGAIHGLLMGSVMGLFALVISKAPLFAGVVFMALFLNLVFATTAGFLVPVLLKWLRLDPALASSVTVTALTETIGYTGLLALATYVLSPIM